MQPCRTQRRRQPAGFSHPCSCLRPTAYCLLLRATWILGLSLVCFAGCTHQSAEAFIPSEQRARQALERALTAWQNGEPSIIKDASPAINVLDVQWRAGKKLAAYEIVGAEPSNGPTWFTVQLTLKNPPAKQLVRYAVVGQDPLWVYREDDYKRSAGM